VSSFMRDLLQIIAKLCGLFGGLSSMSATLIKHIALRRRLQSSHLQFFAVSKMEPTLNSSIIVRMCGVTVVPSNPIMNIWP
jgi:hypothetical protein